MVGSNGSEKDIVGVDQMIQEQHATGEAETGEVDKKVAVKLKSLLSLQQDKDGPAEPVISVPSYPATSMYILAEKETVRSIFLGGGGSTQLIYKGERESYNTLVSSLFCFGPLNPLRIFAFDFINSKLAENATLLLIILNSITLSIDAADFNDEGLKGFLVASEYFFQIAFTIEMLTKILALGFMLHPHSYMRGTWNIIDFVVVMAGFSMFFPGGTNVSVVRLVRVIRPLRTISRVAGMRIIMNSIISSIPTLLEVFVLLSFLIIIFAITGMSLFGSNWHQRCHVVDETNDKLYYPVQNDSIPCGTGRNCSSNGVTLQQICVKGAYRDRILNFDHFLSATLLVIKIITLDDWPDDMRKAQNIAGFYSFAYFLILTIVGSYFCINLVLAILSSVFSEEADAQVMDAVQMSSVVFKEGDCLLSLSNATATNPGGQNPPDGDPSNVLDPNTDTKWTDYNLCELIVSFSSLVTVEAYSWVTAKDAPQCDPVSWRLSGSKDGLSWDHLDEVSDYPTTVERREELPPFTIERPEEYRAYKFTLLKRRIDIEDGELESEEELPTVEVNMNETVNSLDSAARLPWQRVPRRRKSKVKLSIQSTRSSFDEELEESETTLNNIRMRFVHIVCHPMFGWFILFVTIVNVTCMAMDHHGIDKSWKEITDQIIFWCSVVFVAEMFFKIFALGFKRYFQDRYNAFDCILVLISIPELVLAFKDGISGTGVSGSISAFRVFRLARFARVAERLEALRVLLETIVESILSVMYLFLIMLLFIFMFGILGLQLFKNTYPEAPQRYPEDYTAGERSHFDTFPQALLTVFVVITGEAWATVMRDGILGTSWGAALYFVLVFVFGNYVLLNLFIAILIYNFSEASKRSNLEAEDPSEAFAGTPRSVGHAARLLLCDSPRCSREIPNPLNRPASRERGREAIEYSIMWSNPRPENIIAEWLYTKLEEGRQEYRLQGMSFGFFPPDHRLRVFLAGIVLHPFFDYVVIFIILCNVVFLSLDNPSSDENRTRRDLIYITDIIFTVLFFLESVSKCIVLGVYHRVDDEDAEYGNYRTGYLNNVWNRIDMVVVVTAIAGLGFAPFKLFRSLRAVRLVIISVDVRVLVLSLLMALPQIAYVLLVCSFVWLVFGILGVSLFKGSFYYCTDLSVVAKEHCTGLHELVVLGWNGTETILEERQWKRPRYHFDNVGHAMMTLFEVAVGEGWAKIMYTGMDSSLDGDKALRKEANFVHSLYFVMFVIVGGFFAMNLFVGMLIDQFGRVRSEKDGTAFLSEPQRVWLGVAKVMSRTKLYRVPVVQYLNPVLHKISIIARHPYFDHFILGLIVVNLVFMCTAHEGQPVVVTDMLYYVNYTFTLIFAVEAIVKVIGLGPSVYFGDSWCRFDFLLVVSSLLGLILKVGTEWTRVLRIGRIFRLIKRAKSLQKLFTTLMYALPSLANITIFLIVVFFMFGVVGVNLFGRITFKGNEAFDSNTNFRDLGHAIVLLYAVATTETWTDVMEACMVTEGNSGCTDSDDCGTNCCGTQWAVLYFFSFMVLGSFVVLNLFVTVLLDQFQEEDALNSKDNLTKMEIFRVLREKWVHFDTQANSTVPAHVFIGIIRNLPDGVSKDLGLVRSKRNKEGTFMNFLASLSLPVTAVSNSSFPRGYQLHVEYGVAQRYLALRAFKISMSDAVQVQLLTKTPMPCHLPSSSQAHFCIHHYYAVRKLCQATCSYRRRNKAASIDATTIYVVQACPGKIHPSSVQGPDNSDDDAEAKD